MGLYLCSLISEKIAVLPLSTADSFFNLLVLRRKTQKVTINGKVKQHLVQVRTERVKRDLVQVRTTYYSISWSV